MSSASDPVTRVTEDPVQSRLIRNFRSGDVAMRTRPLSDCRVGKTDFA